MVLPKMLIKCISKKTNDDIQNSKNINYKFKKIRSRLKKLKVKLCLIYSLINFPISELDLTHKVING